MNERVAETRSSKSVRSFFKLQNKKIVDSLKHDESYQPNKRIAIQDPKGSLVSILFYGMVCYLLLAKYTGSHSGVSRNKG